MESEEPLLMELPTSSKSSAIRSRTNKKEIKPWYPLPVLIALLVPILFPTGHMLIFYYLWGGSTVPVDREECRCNCWDTVFKGPYESGPGRFKHMYFNSTFIMFKIWTVTVLGLIAIYESFKNLIRTFLLKKLRVTMGVLFLSSLHSHYYAWWGIINYYNDDFYSQWYHQLFFTITELITTLIVVNYFDRTKPMEVKAMLIIATIALFHILQSGLDQFVLNILMRRGELHQVLRDLFFMLTDVLYLSISLIEVHRVAKINGESLKGVLLRKDNVLLVLGTSFGLFVAILVLLS